MDVHQVRPDIKFANASALVDILLSLLGMRHKIQGVLFNFNWYRLKKYGKPRLCESTCINVVLDTPNLT